MKSKKRRQFGKRKNRRSLFQVLEDRRMLVSDWQNPITPADVNDDGQITALDALIVINDLQGERISLLATGELPSARTTNANYVDVNGDRRCSPVDALQVINQLSQNETSADSTAIATRTETAVPLGFQSVTVGQLSGSANQLHDLQIDINIRDSRISEYGLFAMDGGGETVNGFSMDDTAFNQHAWNSRFEPTLQGFATQSHDSKFNAVPGGTQLGAYIILTDEIAEAENNAFLVMANDSSFNVSWEETDSVWPGLEVGGRGYDDTRFTIQIGAPYSPNSPPKIQHIPDLTLTAGEILLVTAKATDSDLPNEELRFSLVEPIPTGATIDTATGDIRWNSLSDAAASTVPFNVRVTDSEGAFDETTFVARIFEESNTPPKIKNISPRSVQVGETLNVTAVATDDDLPDDELRFSLVDPIPNGATIDPISGVIRWTVPASTPTSQFPITVRVTDREGDFDETTFTTHVSECSFAASFGDPVVAESGGSVSGGGNVLIEGCGATITEGDSFAVSLELPFVAPVEPSVLRVGLEEISFDTAATGFHRDAVEIAIVDQNGQPLVNPFVGNRDAAFNLTEGQTALHDERMVFDNNELQIGLSGLPAGQDARLIVRLVNNDEDTQTSVRVGHVSISLDENAVDASSSFQTSLLHQVEPSSSDGTLVKPSVTNARSRLTRVASSAATSEAPMIRVSAPHDTFVTGDRVLLTGSVSAQDDESSIEVVRINGLPVEVIDQNGRFFSTIVIRPGDNLVRVEAIDTAGRSSTTELLLAGRESTASEEIDFSDFEDITSSLNGIYARTSFDEASRRLHVALAVRNDGEIDVTTPLLVAVEGLSDPSVSLLHFDGITPNGLPFIDYSNFAEGDRLLSGQFSDSPTITFDNPNAVQFDYELVFFAKSNQPPNFTSLPVVETSFDSDYRYPAIAKDPEGDDLNFRLLSSPIGMSIGLESGVVQWTSSSNDLGSHEVLIEVADTFGNTTLQSYTLSVVGQPPNRPPVINSVPVTDVYLNEADYSYLVIATDADNDPLQFQLSGPTGMAVTDAGAIQWTPTSDQAGNHEVVITVSDGRGGTASQPFVVCVHPVLSNYAPIFVSNPNPFAFGDSYEYLAEAVDGDGDTLLYSLADAPDGMSINPASGLIEWNVPAADFPASVTVHVSDGNGGFDTQQFTIRSGNGDGSISGVVRGETALQQPEVWTVYLDTNNNERLDTGERSNATNQLGEYTFDGLAAGNFIVRQLPLTGWVQTFPGSDGGIVGDGYPDYIVDFFDSGNGSIAGPYGSPPQNPASSPQPVDANIVVGKPFADGDPASGWISLPTGSYVTVGFSDESIVDGAGDDIFIRSLAPQFSAGESADIFVSSNLVDYVYLGRAPQGGNVGLDLADIGFTDAVKAVRVVGVDNRGSFPGFELISIEVLPDSFGPGDGSHSVNLLESEAVTEVDFRNERVDDTTRNESPTIESMAREMAHSGELYSYQVAASDPENDPIEFQLGLGPAGMTIHPILGTIVWLPDVNQHGEHDILIRVLDGSGNTDEQRFTLIVDPVNTPPIFVTSPENEALVGSLFQYTLNTTDLQDDPVDFRFLELPSSANVTGLERRNFKNVPVGSPIQILWVPEIGDEGPQNFRIRVLDDQGAFSEQNFTVNVFAERNDSQYRVFSDLPTRILAGTAFQHQLKASIQIGNFGVAEGPPEMTIDFGGTINWLPSAKDIGPQRILIRAENILDESVLEKEYLLNVVSSLQNSSPSVVSVPDQYAVANQLFRYEIASFDAENDVVRLELVSGPDSSRFDAGTATVVWIPTDQDYGLHEFVVRATDSYGASSEQSFVVDVRCSNLAPSITSAPLTQTVAGADYLYAVRAVDPEQDLLAYRLVDAPNGMLIDQDSGVIRWSPGTSQIGNHAVSIEAIDAVGGIARQAFSVVVADPQAKIDPTNPASPSYGDTSISIESDPIYTTQVSQLYRYQVIARNSGGAPLSYTLPNAPDGMRISTTGLIEWTPDNGDLGEQVVSVVVTANGASSATQTFVLSVIENAIPDFSTAPITSVTSGETYRYLPRATDADGDRLAFSVLDGPDGLSVSPSGNVTWTTGLDNIGTHPVTLVVNDGRGGAAEQRFTLTVSADTEQPKVFLAASNGGLSLGDNPRVNPGATFVVQVVASDNVAVQTRSLEVNGEIVPIDALGRATITAPSFATELVLLGTATDASRNLGSKSLTIRVIPIGEENAVSDNDPLLPTREPNRVPGDETFPNIEISSPAPNAAVSNVVEIVGTVDDPEDNLYYYRVFAARLDRVDISLIDVSDPDWQVLATSTSETIDGTLATFDPTTLSNDPYLIVVAAYDHAGNATAQTRVINVEGNVQVGDFRLEFTDLALPLSGIPIEITRVYDTELAPDERDFGFGWSLGVQDARILETTAQNNDFVAGETKVYLTGPDGRRIGFTYEEEPIPLLFSGGVPVFTGLFGDQNFRPYFVADPGVTATLSVDREIVARGGLSSLFNFASQTVAGNAGVSANNFDQYTLTTTDGLAYRYDQFAGLQTITDRNDNVVTFTETAIAHSSGQSIELRRDFRGRISEIVVPTADGDDPISLSYRYDARGDLVEFTNQIGLSTTYEYLSDPAHYLESAFDHDGVKVLEVEYDDEGRYVGVFDAAGNLVDSRDYDSDRNTAVIRDGRGNATTLVYDDRGNVLTETDPLGNVTIRRYEDPVNPDLETTIIDRDGFITEQSFDANGNLLSIRQTGTAENPLAQPVTTAFSYDGQNNVTAITNALGHTTTFKYDPAGNLTTITNALGDSSSFTYTDEGRQESFTDFNGNVTRFEYEDACPCGSPSRIIAADGTYQQFEYNLYGQVTEQGYYQADGTLVESSRTIYDQAGRPVQEFSGVGADEIRVAKFYDGDLLDWEVVINPESLDTEGRLTESPSTPVADRKSIITDYDYDALDRLIRETNAEGGVIEYRYDADGNRILLQDPVGNITTWVYDAVGRISEERDPFYNEGFGSIDAAIDDLQNPSGSDCDSNTGAEHVSLTCYTDEGNVDRTIDRNGRRIEYGYDFSSNVTEERWYSNTDELVRTMTFTYDVLGNMLTTQDPDTDYKFTYDVLNRLIETDNNATGSIASPRLILSYGYDAQGNVIETSDDAGVTVGSEYDSQNRLATRTWFDADVQAGEEPEVESIRVDTVYNAAGRTREMIRWADLDRNDLVSRTVRTYTTNGRSDTIDHVDATDAILAGYDYDYNFAGMLDLETRTHQDQSKNQTSEYGYDLTGQLISADYDTQPDETFTYDANGNRLTSTSGDTLQTYVTGTANQLVRDGIYQYEYDDEGNQIKKIEITTGETQTFEFDYRNRLSNVDFWPTDSGDTDSPSTVVVRSQGINYSYDTLGRRSSRIVDSTNLESLETEYYVNEGGNIWLNANQAGEVVARFLFGDTVDQILAESILGIPQFHLTDIVGSSRTVIADSETITATYTYSTFGIPEITSRQGQYAFAGREFDSSLNLYFNRLRFYDSFTGRFVSQDPIGFNGDNSNLYRYVSNAPVSASDPFGAAGMQEYSKTVLVGISAASGAVYGCVTNLESIESCGENALWGGLSGLTIGLFTATAGPSVVGAILTGTFGGLVAGNEKSNHTIEKLVRPYTREILESSGIRLNDEALGRLEQFVVDVLINIL